MQILHLKFTFFFNVLHTNLTSPILKISNLENGTYLENIILWFKKFLEVNITAFYCKARGVQLVQI